MTEHPKGATRLPMGVRALLLVAGTVLGAGVLVALLHTVGLTGIILIAGVLGSFAMVVLTVLRRRPIGIDQTD